MGLTERKVRDAKAQSEPYFLRDGSPKGLSLGVSVAGRKTWVLDYRAVDGRKRRWTIGRADTFTLEQARDAASEALRDLTKGIDPLEVKAVRKARATVSDMLDRYVTTYAPEQIKLGKMKPRTLAEYERQINAVLRPALGKLAVEDVTDSHIEKMVKPLSPVYRNRVLALTSRLFNLAETKWKYRGQHTNPTRGVDRHEEKARQRILSDAEFGALGRALSQMDKGNEWAILAIRIAALTGLRIGEVRKMRWTDIDMLTGRVELPDTKTGARTHNLPAPALALLADAKVDGPFVIAGRNEAAPLDYGVIRKTFVKACKAAEIEGVTLHDLRRSIMTTAASRGASLPMLQDLLGHKTGTMALRYIQMAGKETHDLRQSLGAETAALMDGKQGADVAKMGRTNG